MHHHHTEAIVIGAGVAGMAAAIRLQLKGYQVTVYDKNEYPGGKLSYFEQDGYCFDAGPSLFTQPQNLEALFALAGKPMQAYLPYQAVPVSCHYFYENGKTLKAYTQVEPLAAEMEQQLGEPAANVLAYLQQSGQTYEQVGTLFLNHSLHRWRTFTGQKIKNALKAARWSHVTTSLHRYNSRAFRTPEAVQLFNRYATYNGSNPYQAPAMLSLIPHLEIAQGTYYPQGGMISITRALHQLAMELGVQFKLGTAVQRIIQVDNKVAGVVAEGQNHLAPLVVSNADVYFTYKNLLNQPEQAARILRQERSSSALIFYWGIQAEFKQLGLHNIFFSANYQQEFEHLFKKAMPYPDPTVYINITSKMEATMAPAGCENWFVMVNAPAHRGQNWKELIPAIKEQVLAKLSRLLGRPVAPLIAIEQIMDPPTIEQRTASYMGSLYGTSSNSRLAAFWRHPNFARTIGGLYFVGGSVHPGGGIPLCLQSASIMAGMVPEAAPAPPFSLL